MADCEILNKLDQIVQRSEKWQMPFTVDQCNVTNIGPEKCNYSYSMKGKHLKNTNEELDVGVTISNDRISEALHVRV